MSFSQTKTASDSRVHLSQVSLYKPTVVNGYCYNTKVPDELQPEYNRAIYDNGSFYLNLCNLFHKNYPLPPYSHRHFIDFLKNEFGISTTIIGFENRTTTDLRGTWSWDGQDRKAITIKVNAVLKDHVQNIPIVHECLHAIQDLDEEFKILIGGFHPLLQRMIVERITQKTAIEVVLPNAEMKRCKHMKMTNAQIADRYCVSMDVVNNFRV